MSNLALRLLFAFAAMPVVFFLLWFGDYTRLGMLVFLGGAGAWEWARMVSVVYKGPSMLVVAPVSAVLLTLGWIVQSGNFGVGPIPGLMGILAAAIILLYIAIAFAKVEVAHLFPWWGLQLGAPLFLGLWGGMGALMLGSGHGVQHSYQFLVVMTAMWACDSFAYFTGRAIGKHKFAPAISPKKTWEGAVGGTLACMGWVALFARPVFSLSWQMGLGLGLVLAIAGQLGDLLMSALKRWSGIKDSSNIFPGHGGVLDRFDSYYLAAPMTTMMLVFLKGF